MFVVCVIDSHHVVLYQFQSSRTLDVFVPPAVVHSLVQEVS